MEIISLGEYILYYHKQNEALQKLHLDILEAHKGVCGRNQHRQFKVKDWQGKLSVHASCVMT